MCVCESKSIESIVTVSGVTSGHPIASHMIPVFGIRDGITTRAELTNLIPTASHFHLGACIYCIWICVHFRSVFPMPARGDGRICDASVVVKLD